MKPRSAKTNSVSSDNDMEDTPPSKLPKGRMRRGAVSAEVCTEEDASHYIKKVGDRVPPDGVVHT